MRRPTIKTSMLAIFAAMAVMTGLFAATTLTSLTRVHEANDALSQSWLPSVQAARDIQLSMESTRVAYAGHLSASTALEKSTAEELIKKAQDAFRAAQDRYKPFVDTERETQLVALIDKAYGQYVKFGENMLELSNANDVVMASSVLSRNMKMVAGVAGNSIGELVKINMAGATDSIAQSQSTYEIAVKIAFGLIGLVLALTLAAMLYTLRGITLPIERLTRAMEKLATGDTATIIPLAGRRDELGSMAGAVAVFRDALVATRTLEAEAAESRKRAEEERLAAQSQAEADAAERLARATSGLAVGLHRLAEGDLSVRLEDAFTPEFEALRHDFNASVRQLSETLAAITDGVGTIENGAREISKGTDDLSRRTEQQAASLEETAAALDQITVNVTTSTSRTNEARGVAGQANSTAARSAEVVASAVDAMHRIEAASSQISNIIGVIDEIAFQTNLLALNAGVEAARAGDAGKGFAVVAQEVRELAQRSARAAKEIKELIHNSSVEVSSGVKLVGETGQVLRQIEDYIVTINEHMEAIASSAREQATGLGEVNTAVNQMDHVTQSNAAMVEQTSAASLSLSHEVTRLRDMIGRFNLGKPASPGQALRQTAQAMQVATAPLVAQPAATPVHAPARSLPAVSQGNAAIVRDDWEEF